MTEFNRTSRPSGACNSAAQTGNNKVPTCTPQVAVEELVESFKSFYREQSSTAVYVVQIIETLAFPTRENVFRFDNLDARTGSPRSRR